MKTRALILLLACLAACTACSKTEPEAARGTTVMVSIPPQAFVVRQIGNVLVDISVMLGSGKDPHTFEPAPADVARLSSAMIYFTIDMPYEKMLLDTVRNGKIHTVITDMSAGIRRIPIAHEHRVAGGKIHADEMDRHVWLSPANLIIMAKNTCAALVRMDPAHREAYELNLRAFEIDMNSLHARLSASLAPLKGKRFYTFHPSFGYFADAYGLVQESIEIEGKSPSAREIETVTEKARADGALRIIVQPQFDTRAAETVAEALRAGTVTIDALAPNVNTTLTELGAHMTSLYPVKTAR